MTPLTIPDSLPAFAREYLRLLDEAIRKTVVDATVTSASYRDAAALYRQTGNAWAATSADETADMIERDPRLFVASSMHAYAKDGTAKHMLFTYLELLEKQLEKRTLTPPFSVPPVAPPIRAEVVYDLHATALDIVRRLVR